MPLRSVRERLCQTLAFEAGGLVLAAPFYALLFGSTAEKSVTLVLALSVAVMLWSPFHNTVFDSLELLLTDRVASERPHVLRLLQAISLELTCLFVTLPLVMQLGGHAFWEALSVDAGLTLLYVGYGYFFHVIYDRLRPVTRANDRKSAPDFSAASFDHA